jgi:hypothetical protein
VKVSHLPHRCVNHCAARYSSTKPWHHTPASSFHIIVIAFDYTKRSLFSTSSLTSSIGREDEWHTPLRCFWNLNGQLWNVLLQRDHGQSSSSQMNAIQKRAVLRKIEKEKQHFIVNESLLMVRWRPHRPERDSILPQVFEDVRWKNGCACFTSVSSWTFDKRRSLNHRIGTQIESVRPRYPHFLNIFYGSDVATSYFLHLTLRLVLFSFYLRAWKFSMDIDFGCDPLPSSNILVNTYFFVKVFVSSQVLLILLRDLIQYKVQSFSLASSRHRWWRLFKLLRKMLLSSWSNRYLQHEISTHKSARTTLNLAVSVALSSGSAEL